MSSQLRERARRDNDGDEPPINLALADDRQRLDVLDERRDALVGAMDKVSARFIAQVSDELPARWERIVRLYITDKPERAKEVGREGLSRLKEDLAELKLSACSVAVRHLGEEYVWRHTAAESAPQEGYHAADTSYSRGYSSRWSRVSGPISRAEAEVLKLLHPIFGTSSEPWAQASEGRLSQPMAEMIEAYQQLAVQLDDLDRDRATLQRRISAAEAEALWDDV